MSIPAWAARALETFRPGAPHRGSSPNQSRLTQWAGLNDRLRRRWSELRPEKWRVPESHPAYEIILRSGYQHAPAEYVKQGVLECALEAAWELGSNKHPAAVIEAVRRVDELNDEISEAAKVLARKFRAREKYIHDFSLSDRRADGEECSPDPFDLFGALELALTRPDLMGHRISSFLAVAATGSNPNPTWADLLDEVSERLPRIVDPLGAADIAAVGGMTNRTEWSPWLLRLIGRLGNVAGNGLPDGFFLQCLTNEQLATLAAVVFDAPEDARINGEQVRKLRARHLSRGP